MKEEKQTQRVNEKERKQNERIKIRVSEWLKIWSNKYMVENP